MRRPSGVALGLCALLLTSGPRAQPPPGAEAPPPSAAQTISAAAAALGQPAALERAGDLEAEHTGWYYAQEQGRDPREPWARVERRLRWVVDADGGRLWREAEQVFPGGIRFLTAQGLAATGGWQADLLKWRTGVDLQTFGAAEVLGGRAQFERLFPHLLLRQLRAASEPVLTGEVVSFRDPAGATIQVAFDPLTRLPVRATQVRDGVPQTEVVYGDYAPREGVMLPNAVQVRQGGQLQEDLRLAAVRFGAAADDRFSPPAGYAGPPAPGAPALRPLARGVGLFENMPGDYRSMLVDAGGYLVVLEAPLSPAYGLKQLELARQAHPAKAVRYVVVTHPHGDHTGGLKPWVEAGAVILAPKGSAVALRRQLTARGVTRPVTIEEVGARRTLGAGAGRLELHGFASSHAEANLLVHLPASKTLFQGDMLYVPARGEPPPAFAVVLELMAELRRLRIAPELIVGVHGRPATMAEAELSLQRSGAAAGRRSERRGARLGGG